MNALFVLDDCTDKLELGEAKRVCEATVDAIMNPDKSRPEGEHIIVEIVRQ